MPPDNKQAYQHEEYTARINRVIDYIQTHLSQELSLDTLAGVANFSKFHFHRLFRVMTGETLNQFIQRLRLEKAANQLIHNPKKSITEIALDSGFSGSATFARAFKEMYQMSASDWRAGGYRRYQRKIGKTESNAGQTAGKNWQEFDSASRYIDPVTLNLTWRIKMINQTEVQVEVQEMPARPGAYVRHIGPYKGDSQLFAGLFEKLMRWAGPRGLLQNPAAEMLAVYHDDPEITADERLRVDVCLTVPAETPVEGEVGKMTIPGGQYAVARFELSDQEYEAAWQLVYGQWLPQSGYQPDDRPAFERYVNDPEEHPEHKHIVDICVPVKPL
ncbi:MAG TPA: AraC family transcriptional regulator [Anaerolineae bacterium]|nr:AraC family transcriptional regulator [Anaerolineae bacterium]